MNPHLNFDKIKLWRRRISLGARWGVALIGVFLIFSLFQTVSAIVRGGSLIDLVWLAAGDLDRDSAGRTNVVFFGAGGAGHSGGELTDTILVGSFDSESGTAVLLSIPRDLWVDLPDGESMRINRVLDHEIRKAGDQAAGFESTAGIIGDMVGLEIPYYAEIEFDGFRQVVDALGGITVAVPEAINDPDYPCDDMVRYCPFRITAGVHQMDGETALKYARSRKTTSDFSRAARQQQVIEALREQALATQILTSPTKLRALYDAIEGSFTTNIRFREALKFGEIATNLDRSKIVSSVLSDYPEIPGGILFAPDRSGYGGASVLRPIGEDPAVIAEFGSVLFGHTAAVLQQRPVEVLNASGRGGIASQTAYFLYRYGVNADKANNYPGGQLATSRLYYFDPASAETAAIIAELTGVPAQPGPADLAGRGFDPIFVIGADWQIPAGR